MFVAIRIRPKHIQRLNMRLPPSQYVRKNQRLSYAWLIELSNINLCG